MSDKLWTSCHVLSISYDIKEESSVPVLEVITVCQCVLVCGGLVIINMDRVVDISKVIEISGTDTDDNKLIWMLHFILMLHINNLISNSARKWIKHLLQHRYTIPSDIPNINYDNFRFFELMFESHPWLKIHCSIRLVWICAGSPRTETIF